MTLYLLALLVSLAATTIAIRLAHVAGRQLDAAERELAALQARTLHAEATVDTAIGQLEDLRQLRVDDVQRMRADVRELRDTYANAIREYERKHGLDRPLASNRLH